MTNTKLNEAMKAVFTKWNEEEVAAVYLTGSSLNNLTTPESDVDLYVLLKQSKHNAVFGNLVSGQLTGEHDFKYMETYKFVQLMAKMNPTVTELVFKKPLFVSSEFEPMANYLYENRMNLFMLNPRRYFSSAYHMMENNLKEVKKANGKSPVGKKLVNFFRVYNQATATAKGQDPTPLVSVNGDYKDFLMDLKVLDVLTESELENMVTKMENALSELNEARMKFDDMKELNSEMVEVLLSLV